MDNLWSVKIVLYFTPATEIGLEQRVQNSTCTYLSGIHFPSLLPKILISRPYWESISPLIFHLHFSYSVIVITDRITDSWVGSDFVPVSRYLMRLSILLHENRGWLGKSFALTVGGKGGILPIQSYTSQFWQTPQCLKLWQIAYLDSTRHSVKAWYFHTAMLGAMQFRINPIISLSFSIHIYQLWPQLFFFSYANQIARREEPKETEQRRVTTEGQEKRQARGSLPTKTANPHIIRFARARKKRPR